MFHHSIKPRLDWVLFLLIYFQTWLNCTSQSYCNFIPTDINPIVFDHIEPIEISSAGEAVKIYYNTATSALTWNVDKIEFELASTPGPIFNCKNITITQGISLIISCDTTPVSSSININYEFNSSLNLIVKFGCLASHGDFDPITISTFNSSRLIDPYITNLPPFIFYNHTTIFELVYLVKHPQHNIHLESSFVQCNETQSTPNRTRFACKYFHRTNIQALDLHVKINGKKYKKISCNVFPAPVLNGVVGSTFAGANNPILIIGNHFNAAFDKYVYLKTNLTNRSKCILVNSTCIRCFSGLGVKPVKVKTQLPFTIFFNELTEFTNQSLSLTVNPNPIIISISYSFTENLLYTNIIHFSPYYKPFTNFRIFDPNREDYMNCKILPQSQLFYLVCRPWAKLAEKGFNKVHVNINISIWMISYKNVLRYQEGSDYQLIITYLVLTVSVFVVLALITYYCLRSAKPNHSAIEREKIASKTLESILSGLLRKRELKAKALQDAEQLEVDVHESPERLVNTKPEKATQHKRRRKSESKGKGRERR